MNVKEREDELADLLAAKTAECQRLRDSFRRLRLALNNEADSPDWEEVWDILDGVVAP